MDEAVTTIHHEIYHHKHYISTRNSPHIWGGDEGAAEDYGRRMLEYSREAGTDER